MSDQLAATRGIANVETEDEYDAEVYKRKALERSDRIARGGAPSKNASSGVQSVKSRRDHVDFGTVVGKAKMVNPEGSNGGRVGFFCKVCELTFPDSGSYLIHINSSSHQSRLGLTMEVEKSTIDAVKARLTMKIREKYEHRDDRLEGKTFIERVKDLHKEDAEKKAKRLELKKKRKEDKKKEEQAAEEGNQDMMALMGFSSFK
mmetsp:Transcript_7489/g.12026  ORF Transcript_7489/g.12026 Transcript_7489/m.12026 type:complete len:204 (+) Transcript_7489:239-850(+)|eukprot:CAMPEP_0203771600 /NCGR_PEP_ID=MMETSP0099_2-20121227/3505_1 /ASSEMBLY_ACC=CAM_ASM_000209 /TAXON_ID=96639 /ORGANISM=" , Strain NY0313808BC1" /LENGTH=203 /DNA_ID=CAMNT_0050668963 /DNA_START=128 /DNA_END=739 /DNA_ORIENTATION=-